jgi:putative PIG3 family NAD(P)H quinone oxidoreductase
MRVAIYDGAGGPEVIRFGERPSPALGAGEIRVRVQAAGLNRADVLQRKGHYPAPAGVPADSPGLEYAGEVIALGEGVSRWRIGARVMGLVGGGAMAEEVVVDQHEAMLVPPDLDIVQAAAIPEAFLTAWDALTVRGRLREGERVLIHAAASGVGTAAIQLAGLLGAGQIIGTSRRAAKLDACRALGLDVGIDTTAHPDFDAVLPAPVDLILDVLGAGAFNANLRALAPRGRLVMLGLLQGARGTLDLGLILQRRLEIIGTTLRSRGAEERRPLVADVTARVLPALADGRLQPVVHAVLPMAQLADAQAMMEADQVTGKIVLTW